MADNLLNAPFDAPLFPGATVGTVIDDTLEFWSSQSRRHLSLSILWLNIRETIKYAVIWEFGYTILKSENKNLF